MCLVRGLVRGNPCLFLGNVFGDEGTRVSVTLLDGGEQGGCTRILVFQFSALEGAELHLHRRSRMSVTKHRILGLGERGITNEWEGKVVHRDTRAFVYGFALPS